MANEEEGVQWKKTGDRRSTTASGIRVWSKVARAVQESSEQDPLVNRIEGCSRDWRKVYQDLLHELTDEMVAKNKVLEACKAGIEATHEEFTFCRNGEELPLKQAMAKYAKQGAIRSYVVRGEGGSPSQPAVSVQFDVENNDYSASSGQDLLNRVDDIVKRGEVEPDVFDAIKAVVENEKEYLESLKSTYFVLFGATSELCPLYKLLELGLTVVAISRPSAKQAKMVERAKATPGTLILPVKDGKPDEESGADVLVDTPELRTWLLSFEKHKRLVLGSYIYIDGEGHARASVACDVIFEEVLQKRPDTALAFLSSPATSYVIPSDAAEAAEKAWENRTALDSIGSIFLGPYKPNVSKYVKLGSKKFAMMHAYSNMQGPSYALAKTLQNWRSIVAREMSKATVSANMAPTSKTQSMVHVRTVELALKGMRDFPPLTYFMPETASALMALLLIYDLCNKESAANPEVKLDNPIMLLSTLGVHGGLWRSPYSSESIGKAMVIRGWFSDMFS